MIIKRNFPGDKVVDPSSIDNLQFNVAAGAQKQINVGCKLIPLRVSATTYTTDATTARALPSIGRSVAVFNKGATIEALTFGTASNVAALAIGVVAADPTDSTKNNVGIPCLPGDWTYLSSGDRLWLKTTSANLVVFLIDDDTFLTIEDPN